MDKPLPGPGGQLPQICQGTSAARIVGGHQVADQIIGYLAEVLTVKKVHCSDHTDGTESHGSLACVHVNNII